jgi:hypothetical protein
MTTRKVAPITPQEIENSRLAEIPDAVIECFNAEIARNFFSNVSIVLRNEIKALIKDKIRDRPFQAEWLDIEPIYEQAGWSVRYERDMYGLDNFQARFRFTRK